ncbi:MAG: threonine aldolase family protein [Gemmobacter sp.]
MNFASDNTAPVPTQVIAALVRANDGYAMGYGNDPLTARVQARIREVFEAPEAAVHLVSTGTAANSLALACLCPPWGAVFCEAQAHVTVDECGAPEFFTGGAKLVGVEGAHGRMSPEGLAEALSRIPEAYVHSVQRAALTITNVTEAGTVYEPDAIATLTALARARGMRCHLDGARFANALAATGATPAEMTWKAGIDAVSFGGTKNGLMGVEAVVIFDPARAWEFELRRKRAGHLSSKMRYLAAQMDGWLDDGLWLSLARQANTMAARLVQGIAPHAALLHPVEANMIFVRWPAGTHERLRAAGAVYYPQTGLEGSEAARLVTSWCTTAADVDAFVAALKG